ncbi:penicillin-binding transpeptidase domain-containing protein [Pseudoduganella chitinolytica]|uniref:Penicillin-binding transpeptidase domain-containing protein n=1 Tax=Pseudoduganella chitinolytica TaxID=34070 RepID=A0ABY8BKU9_9BURK|nr:penicillin-binding transpeptidase domain-containing protein [Pseudoduganella chitinolytica]WEF34999.1 penicillin-binding transpeptidase domain-containing protein [Pseudoduganella chitinolytica]
MPPFLAPLQRLLADLATRRRAWRRAANLRRSAPRAGWQAFALPLALVALAAGGAALIAGHARRLGDAIPQPWHTVTALQAYVPGAAFTVPATGVQLLLPGQGALAIAAGMRAAPPVRIDLCRQLRAPGRAGALVPLRLGYQAGDVRRWAGAPGPERRNVVLVDAQAGLPQVQLSGNATADFDGTPLRLAWQGTTVARWLGGADGVVAGPRGAGQLTRQGWLAWPGGALHVERRASAACPAAGELVLRLYQPADDVKRAVVTAFGKEGSTTVTLAPGDYRVPAAAPPALEDAALFTALQQAGLLRLSRHGAIALAPADLAAWQQAPPAARAAALPEWAGVRVDAASRKLLRRLYRQADGAYLRRQVELYNSERSLLAWRVPDGDASTWQASGAAGPLTVTGTLPPAAARLFDTLSQGWQPWSRVARWPAGDQAVRLAWTPGRPASGTERVRLLLAGRVVAVTGATVETLPACDGRACGSRDDVTQLVLRPQPGARAVVVAALPLATARLERPGERRYRHLRVADGRIEWLPLGPTAALPAAAPGVPVTIADRHGTPLWADGRPTAAAIQAGLGTLVGLGPQQDSGVAAQLMRAGAGATGARLTVDLPLQALAHDVLACVGMRRGTWDGRRCAGGTAPPRGREAGIVLLDSENGDILAAAGFGTGRADTANWAELRDFDRANPARSPLRLPALQHDGGARRSPGSTFKIVSALGLEMAARTDPRLEALLSGVPLARLDTLAHERGFDFAAAAATYPVHADVHVTNYRELGLAGRAQDGRLGLAQALTYSLNTWFAWTGELSDATLLGRPDGGVADAQALQPGALDAVRPILAAARRLGFEQPMRLDGGLLPADVDWRQYDALQATPARIDPISSRHELRQMSIGLRMQATPLQMALAAGAIGQGATVAPRLLAQLDGRAARQAPAQPLDVRLDRIRAGLQGVVERGTAATAFRCAGCAPLRAGLYGKTGTAPVADDATVWFTGWLEPDTLPGQRHRLAFAVFVSRSEAGGGDHAAPVVAALLATLAERRTKGEMAVLIGQ